MAAASKSKLDQYVDVIMQVGLNLRPGQRLLIVGSTLLGVDLSLAPFVRKLAQAAYRRGASFVDVVWRDPQQDVIRLREAPEAAIGHYPRWPAAARLEHLQAGDAYLSIHAEDPELLAGFKPGLIGAHHSQLREHSRHLMDFFSRNAVNWCVVTAPLPAWSATVLPKMPASRREARLWNLIFAACRVGKGSPVAAWRKHIAELAARADHLNRKQYSALVYTGPGTHLKIGLPPGHIWHGGGARTEGGIDFVPNLPTEEIFTLPHRLKVDGEIASTKPFAYAGATIDGIHLRFEEGRVVKFTARKGEGVLAQLLKTDEGAARLGEVALVPNSSPISRLGVTFHNALYDENAASHLAFGDAFRFTLTNGEAMSAEQFAVAGGNHSDLHSDFMVGSGKIDIDGLLPGGQSEPVMRLGEWAFKV